MGVKNQSQSQVVRVWLDGCGGMENDVKVKEAVDYILSHIHEGEKIRYDKKGVLARAPAPRCFDIHGIRVCLVSGYIDIFFEDMICDFTAIRLEPTDTTVTLKEAVERIRGEGKRLCKGFFKLPKNMRTYDEETYADCVGRCIANAYVLAEPPEDPYECEQEECSILRLSPQERLIDAIERSIDLRTDYRLTKTYVTGMGKYCIEYSIKHRDIEDLGLRVYMVLGEVCGGDIRCLEDRNNFEIYCIEPIYKH